MTTTLKTHPVDEMAWDIFRADNSSISEESLAKDWAERPNYHRPYAENIAEGLNDKGYCKPRIIETVEELEALAVGSILRLASESLPADAAIKIEPDRGCDVEHAWRIGGYVGAFSSAQMFNNDEPTSITVLHEPEAEVGA